MSPDNTKSDLLVISAAKSLGSIMAGSDNETFFNKADSPFPELTEDGKIDMDKFLLASNHLAHFFGNMTNLLRVL